MSEIIEFIDREGDPFTVHREEIRVLSRDSIGSKSHCFIARSPFEVVPLHESYDYDTLKTFLFGDVEKAPK